MSKQTNDNKIIFLPKPQKILLTETTEDEVHEGTNTQENVQITQNNINIEMKEIEENTNNNQNEMKEKYERKEVSPVHRLTISSDSETDDENVENQNEKNERKEIKENEINKQEKQIENETKKENQNKENENEKEEIKQSNNEFLIESLPESIKVESSMKNVDNNSNSIVVESIPGSVISQNDIHSPTKSPINIMNNNSNEINNQNNERKGKKTNITIGSAKTKQIEIAIQQKKGNNEIEEIPLNQSNEIQQNNFNNFNNNFNNQNINEESNIIFSSETSYEPDTYSSEPQNQIIDESTNTSSYITSETESTTSEYSTDYNQGIKLHPRESFILRNEDPNKQTQMAKEIFKIRQKIIKEEQQKQKIDKSMNDLLLNSEEFATNQTLKIYIDKLREWTGMEKYDVIYNSKIHSWNKEVLYKRLMYKPNIMVLIFTTDGYLFGNYNKKRFPDCENEGYIIDDHHHFIFSLKNPFSIPPCKFVKRNTQSPSCGFHYNGFKASNGEKVIFTCRWFYYLRETISSISSSFSTIYHDHVGKEYFLFTGSTSIKVEKVLCLQWNEGINVLK